jgi:hypothetical protein
MVSKTTVAWYKDGSAFGAPPATFPLRPAAFGCTSFVFWQWAWISVNIFMLYVNPSQQVLAYLPSVEKIADQTDIFVSVMMWVILKRLACVQVESVFLLATPSIPIRGRDNLLRITHTPSILIKE